MRCPTLNALPPAPPDRSGWPWTEESPQLPETMPDGSPWPRVSIVTPSYNQGQFIEETIRSVLLQGYPNLEYIVIDGGSTDESVEIIRKYAPWLAYWVSEKDRGQSHAINKGFERSTGEILAWLNSDDMYAPSALATILSQNCMIEWIVGASYIGPSWDSPDKHYALKAPKREQILEGRTFLQPSSFFSRSLYQNVGGIDEKLNFVMDYELWCRFIQVGAWPHIISDVLSLAREQPGMKTQASNYPRITAETAPIIRRNLGAIRWHMRMLRRFSRRVRGAIKARVLKATSHA